MHDVLYAAIKRATGGWDRRVGAHAGLEGAAALSDAVLVDQTPIGRTPRSNPVTYLKAFDPIRELFAQTREARARGLSASHFSFNVPGGRCDGCDGEGVVRVEMQFLADVFVPCDQCDGTRFKPQVLEVTYRGRSVHDVLQMTVHEALHFFGASAKVAAPPRGARRDRPRLPAPGPAGDDAVRRRGAAHQDRGPPRLAPARAGRCTSSTSPRRACTSTTSRSSWPRSASCCTPGTACSSSSTTSTSSRRRTGSSTSGPREAATGDGSSSPGRPEQVAAHPGLAHRPPPAARARGRARPVRPAD